MQTAKQIETQLERYRLHLVREEYSPETVQKYLRDIRFFLRTLPEGGCVTKEAVLSYKGALLESRRVSSANSMLVALNVFLSFLGRPECRVKLFRVQRRTFRDRELSRGEYLRLVRAAQRRSERLALLLQTLCSTGIRVSEHRFITVEALKSGAVQITNKGKTRHIVLQPKLCSMLKRYCARRGVTGGPVFVSRSGRPLGRSNIWREMKRLSLAAGVEPGKVFPHNLRHLFAVCYYQQEKDIVHLADILGHASIETTRIYTSTSPEQQAQTLSRLHLLL